MFPIIFALTLFAVPMAAKADAETAAERLAEMFSPILILTEETGGKWGDIKVIKPEPVEIMGATSAGNIWFELSSTQDGRPVASGRLSSLIGSGVLDKSDIKRNQASWSVGCDGFLGSDWGGGVGHGGRLGCGVAGVSRAVALYAGGGGCGLAGAGDGGLSRWASPGHGSACGGRGQCVGGRTAECAAGVGR